MQLIKTIVALGLAACTLAIEVSPAAAADPTLAIVKKRGTLACGIDGQLPGFSAMNDKKEWAGLEIDFCRAIAAAVLGDATKVKFVPLTTAHRFDALRSGEIDVLMRNSTTTLERTVKTGVRDAAVYYIDGQAVAVPKKLGVNALEQVAGNTICILNNTPYGRNIREWFAFRKLPYTAVTFDAQNDMYAAFFAGKCNALTQDISAITTTIVASGHAADYLVLPEIVAKDPLAAYVRANDEQWLDVVRWTFNALLDAEERVITRANVQSQREIGTPSTKRLLGVPDDDGKLLGLGPNWAYDAIKQVGNYSEIYERNLGRLSPIKFPRGINALWSAGGVLYPLPLR